MEYLNIGCGNHKHPDWTNIDLLPLRGVGEVDARDGLPFADSFFDVVYLSHVLEHFAKRHAPLLAAECFRILRPKGILRVVVPDLALIARNYLEQHAIAQCDFSASAFKHDWSVIHLIDQMTRTVTGGEMVRVSQDCADVDLKYIETTCGHEVAQMIGSNAAFFPTGPTPSFRLRNIVVSSIQAILGRIELDDLEYLRFLKKGEVHRWMYDNVSLSRLLTNSGFIDTSQKDAYSSSIAEWSKFHLDVDIEGRIFHPDSLFMEARRPG